MGLGERYARRLDHLFSEAERLTKLDAREIRAKAAAEGSLKSGASLKRIVRVVEDRARTAVEEGLASLDRRALRESTRDRLRAELKARLCKHLNGDVRGLPNAAPFGDAVIRAVEDLFSEAEARLVTAVDQHATGFAPGTPVSWVKAHPTFAFVITTGAAVLAIIISIIALLSGQ